MTSLVVTDQPRRHVVGLDNVTGEIRGSGVLVAPGWVLTCAHVVGEQERMALTAAPGVDVPPEGRVVARSAPRPGLANTQLWPFADLALVRFEPVGAHPCALLYPSPVGGAGSGWVAWGHARREFGVDPVGSPATFDFQGVEGDGYLSLTAGIARPGLSGSPLVSSDRRAVVGVMPGTPYGPPSAWRAADDT